MSGGMSDTEKLEALILMVVVRTKHGYPTCDETNCAKCLAEKMAKGLQRGTNWEFVRKWRSKFW